MYDCGKRQNLVKQELKRKKEKNIQIMTKVTVHSSFSWWHSFTLSFYSFVEVHFNVLWTYPFKLTGKENQVFLFALFYWVLFDLLFFRCFKITFFGTRLVEWGVLSIVCLLFVSSSYKGTHVGHGIKTLITSVQGMLGDNSSPVAILFQVHKHPAKDRVVSD